ncbi:MAG: transglycosylase SLT domain-containing protein [Gemmatimonadetes bacterium]|nr:transglycosylase SLT domain-containing protein [Gemmatimonadota bacterium]
MRAQRRAGDLTGAARTAEAAANGLDAARGRARAWRQTGELRLALGDTAAARAALLRAMEAAPMVMAAVEAANLLYALPPGPADERLRVGRLYLRHGNLTRGIEALLAFLATSALPPVERAEIRLELGRAYFRAARYAEAERALLELAADAPSSAIAAEALFLAGRAQYRQGREADARATLLRTAERHPRERAAAEALFLLADFDHDDGRLESAREYYRRVADTRPELSQAGLALMRLGGMAWLAGDAARAAEIFDEYRGKQPDRPRYQQASYWAARAYQRAGAHSLAAERLREARRVEPLSYYGLRAAELLGEPPLGFAMEAAPALNPAWEAEVATAVARLDLLRELGLAEEAAFEVERLKRHFAQQDGKLYALAEALNERGYTYTGILIGREMQRREGAWNPRLLRIVYPFPYRNLVLAEAEERGLYPFLHAGLIRQESMYNAQVVSPAGAIGLMQLMPRTGRMLAQSAGVRRFAADLLEHPELNLHLGAAYLAELLGRYGRRSAALAAYNAGPHRVSRWRAYPEFADDELFAERIPFAETREYLKAVQQNARLYALLYGPIPAAVRGHSGGASR